LLDTLLAPFNAVGDLIGAGGSLVGWICATGILLWALVFERWWFFQRRLPGLVDVSLKTWRARAEHHSWASHQIRQKLISCLTGEMSANMPTLKVLVPLCPLLGLVGTVLGMLEVFDSMAILGSADARAMASGVSKAMNCTLTGLAVSISGMYPVYYFHNRIKRQSELLADQFEY
jgi:biopolymer transport protein ExbB